MEEKQSAREIASDYLLSRIKSGELKPGDKIVNERKLAQILGISRVPLREAICALSTVGVLEARQGDGTFVSNSDAGTLAKAIKTYGLFDRSLVDEVFEARILFEADAAKLAAANRTEQDLEQLYDVLKAHEEAVLLHYEGSINAADMMDYDGAVHMGIAAATHNNFIVQIIEAIRHVTVEKGMFGERYTVNKEHFKQSVVMHRKIVTAIERRDAEEAYRNMQQHIMQVRDAVDLDSIRRNNG